MNEILNNNYSLDIRDYDEGYLSHLKNDIYKMTVKLKEANDLSLKDKKMLEETLSDISHQLKTPLTSMYVLNELLGQDLTKTRRQELLAKNYNQLTRIEWLVTSLLKISMLDSGTVQLIKKPVKLKDIISKALEPLIIPIELKEVKLEIECNPKIKAKLDFNWTVESFMNIIKNAYEHTNSGGTITIKVQDNPIYVEVRIMDTGEGINENDINHIFERFYKSKSSGKDSIGIGLNMAKKIIDLESGDIRANSKLKLGSEFTIKFYKN